MKRKSKLRWKRILVLVLMVSVLTATMPMAVFAEEVQLQQENAEIEEQRGEVMQLEAELNNLLAAEASTSLSSWSEIATVYEDYAVTVEGEGESSEVGCGRFKFSICSKGTPGDYVAWLDSYEQAADVPDAYQLVIPNTVIYEAGGTSYQCPVVRIGEEVFSKNTAIGAVTLPETVDTIRNWAFMDCTNLASINLPAALTTLGNYAFKGCSALELTLPDGRFPAGLTAVGRFAFKGCTALELDAAVILSQLTSIGEEAFSGTGVYGVLAPPEDTTIESYAFSGTKITKLDLTSNPNHANVIGLAKDCSLLTEVEFHPETTYIGIALAENSGVTSVFIPKTVTQVYNKAFKNCPITQLTFEPREYNVNLVIGTEAFYGNKLTSFTFPTMENKAADLTLSRDCFAGSDMTTLVLDENTTACHYIICESPFRGQPIENVTLPKYDDDPTKTDVIFIPEGLFWGSAITSTEFLEYSDVRSLGAYAFADCDQLVEYTNGLQCSIINAYAFQGCDNLTTFQNMDVVNIFGDYAFSNCDSITQLEFWTESDRKVTDDDDNYFTWGVGFVSGSDNLETIVIHGTGSVSAQPTENASKVSWDDLLPFEGCDGVEFVFDGGITTVGMGAFAGAYFLKNLDFLPETVTRYENYAFAYTGLQEVTVPAHVTYVEVAFAFCDKLVSLTIENEMDAWQWLYVDEDREMDGINTVNDGMKACAYFQGAPLKSPGDERVNVTLPKSWTTLPDGMFYGTGITDTYFLEDMPRLKSISPYAFANCDEMEEIVIPKTVESLAHRAFYNSVATVSSLTIPYNVKSLETYGGQDWPLYQQFYDEEMEDGTLLQEVRIYNPELDLDPENAYLLNENGELVDEKGTVLYDKEENTWNPARTDIYESYIFNYNQYSSDVPLILRGPMNSAALSLVAKDGGSCLSFVPLSAAEEVTVTLQYPDGTEYYNWYDITWTDESGKVIATGNEFRPPEENTVYYYTIELDDWDYWIYQTPAKGKITSSTEQGEDIVITLKEIGTTDLTGKVVDENGDSVKNAEVLLNYIIGDQEIQAGVVYTDETGTFTLTGAKDMRTEAFVDMYGYYTGTAVYLGGEGKESVDLGTIALQKLPGTATQLVVEVRSADGSSRILRNLEDLIFTVGDGVSGEQISASIENNVLTLRGAAIKQDHPLKLKVMVKEGAEMTAPSGLIDFTLGEGAYVTLTEFGRFSLEAEGDGSGQNVWVFEDGNLMRSYDMSENSMISEPMAAGTYTLVVMDRTAPIVNPASIKVITDLGFKTGEHFAQTEVAITDGEMTLVQGLNVPRLDDTALSGLFTDMFETVKLTSSVRSPMAGQEYHLMLDYELKDTYAGKEKVFTFTLPQGTKLLEVYTPAGTNDSYEPVPVTDASSVKVKTAENKGIISLAVKSSTPVEGSCSVTVSCDNQSYAQKKLNYQVVPAEVKIYSYNATPPEPFDYAVTVKAVPESQVTLYVNGEPAATAEANMVGTARFEIDLPLPAYTGREWGIHAEVHYDGGFAESEQVMVTQDSDPLNPVITLNMEYKFYMNYPELNPSSFIVHLGGGHWRLDPDLWMVEVAEGRGSQILNGVIEIKFRNSATGTSYRIPCYRVGTSDVFQGMGYADDSYDYLSLDYEVTDDFWETAGNGTGVDEASMAAHQTEVEGVFATYGASDFLDTTYIQKLEDSQKAETLPIDQMPEFQALSQEEQQQILQEQAEMELKLETVQESNRALAEQLFGYEIDWEADSAEEMLAQVGYESRQLEKGELKEIENDSKFLPMLFGSSLIYYYADQYETITVDVSANTITTMQLPAVPGTAATFRSRGSTNEVADDAQTLDAAISAITTTYSQMSNGVDIEIDILETTCDNYVEHMQKYGFEHPGHAAAAARLTVLKAFKKVLPVINNLLNIGTVIGMAAELWDISDTLDRLRATYNAGGMKADCAQATLNLIHAYEDLAEMIFAQAMSALAQIGATIGFTALALVSRVASVIGLVVSSVAGMVADLFIGYYNDQSKAKAQQAQRIRASVCDEEEEEEEDEIPVNPIVDPSGYVYEAVFSNRVEGAAVTTYYNNDGTATVWDAENYDQVNPLVTDEYGFYQWFVPRGQWKVVAEKEGYETSDTTEIYDKLDKENDRDDIVNGGWLTVLPEQLEVHIPMESTEAPQVQETAGYTDGISIQFSQYMKEDITVSVTQNGTTYSGDDLELVWTDREYSDHYYNEWFGSQLSIRLKNGQWAQGEATVNITSAKNYVGTNLEEVSRDVTVLSMPAAITAAESMEIPFCGTDALTVTVTDANGSPVSGVSVEAKSAGFAKVRTEQAVTDSNGAAVIDLEGYAVGQGTVTLSVAGTTIEKAVAVTVIHDSTMYKPAEPVVYINGEEYRGQGHSITVAKGTQVTIVGSDSNQFFYSIGEDSCPCEEETQVKIEGMTMTLNESGYYKFAAYAPASGQYSDRVHISVELTDAEIPKTITEVVLTIDHLPPELGETAYPATLYSVNGSTDPNVLDILIHSQAADNYWGHGWSYIKYDDSDDYYSMEDYINSFYSNTVFGEDGYIYTCLKANLRIDDWSAPATEFSDDLKVILQTADGQRFEMRRFDRDSDELYAVYYYKVVPVEPAPRYENEIPDNENGYVTVSPETPKAGQTVTVTGVPDSLYWKTASVIVQKADSTSVEVTRTGDNTFTFVQPEEAVTISAEFGPKSNQTYEAAVVQPDEGAVITLLTGAVTAGSDVRFTVETEAGFELWYCDIVDSSGEFLTYYEDWSGDSPCYVFEMPEGGATISVTVTPITYYVYTSVYGDDEWGEGGSAAVLPENAHLGDTVSVMVFPERGYYLHSLLLTYWDRDIYEEVPLTATKINSSHYTFRQPNGDVNISLIFRSETGDTLVLGDVNLDGEITAADLTMLARHVAKIETITDTDSLFNAEVTGDQQLTAEDLTKLARYVAKIIDTL